MTFAWIQMEKAHYPLTKLCRWLGVTRSGFYAWQQRPASPRSHEDQRLKVLVHASFTAGRGYYGSPRVHDDHQIGAYEVVSLLGAGGMGEVYRARDTKLHRDVALSAERRHVSYQLDPHHRRRIRADVNFDWPELLIDSYAKPEPIGRDGAVALVELRLQKRRRYPVRPVERYLQKGAAAHRHRRWLSDCAKAA